MAGRYLVTGAQLGSLIALCKLDAVKCNDLLVEITEKQFIGNSNSSIAEDVDKYSKVE